MSHIIRCKIAGWPMYNEDDIYRSTDWLRDIRVTDVGFWCTM